jgi:hypothetical protein
VCPKESEDPTQAQYQPSFAMQASPPTQDEDQVQDDEDKEDEPPQEEDFDQWEDEDNEDKEEDKEIRDQRPRTQESIKQFKGIIPSTPFLVTFRRG